MEELRVPRLLAGALAAVSGAVVASLFGIEGTLIGAALVSLLVAPAEALYAHSLASAHKAARRSLIRRVGEQAGTSQEATSQADPQPIRWQRVAVAAVVAFGLAVAAITGVEAVANQPLASLLGSRPRQGGSTSVGLVVGGADRSAPPATRAPATSTVSTSPSGSAATTMAPLGVATTTAPASTIPSTTAATTTTTSVQAPTTQGR